MMMMSVRDQDFSSYRMLLTLAEVAEILNFDPRTIERRCERGVFPKPVRMDGSRRWWKSEIIKYLEDCEAQS